MKLGWSFWENSSSVLNNEDVSKSFTKCFSSLDGKRVLAFLSAQVKERFLGPNSSSNELWFLEGKRALLAQIENLISNGKKGE
jgi:hypothetical protein